MPLARRELEVARLIADGMTTREVASKLFMSERTVETHVTNMLSKLGLGSQIQLTSGWLDRISHTRRGYLPSPAEIKSRAKST